MMSYLTLCDDFGLYLWIKTAAHRAPVRRIGVGVIDFERSFMTFFGRNEGNIARILLDATCTVVDERTGESQSFYLIAPCRSERMYLDSQLFQEPNYEFCGIFAADECLIIRTHWNSTRDNREYGRNTERFSKVELDIRTHAEARELTDDRQIYDATLANLPLVAQTELRDEARGLRATIQYPMKTINVLPAGPRFQVDTGPLLLPDFASTAARAIERFDLAHVVYHRFDQAEFVLRRPVAVSGEGTGPTVTDYSVIQSFPARNTILSVG